MTLEQIKLQELERLQSEIDKTEDNLVHWMHELLKDSIAEVNDSIAEVKDSLSLTEWQLKKISQKLAGNLIFDIDDGPFEHLSRQVKKLKTLYKDFDYLSR